MPEFDPLIRAPTAAEASLMARPLMDLISGLPTDYQQSQLNQLRIAQAQRMGSRRSHLPGSLGANMRGSGRAATGVRLDFEDAGSWTSAAPDMGSDADVWADAWSAPHRLARDYGDRR
jgi:hypothetical protein